MKISCPIQAIRRNAHILYFLLLLSALLIGCQLQATPGNLTGIYPADVTPTTQALLPTDEILQYGLSLEEATSLRSLSKVDDYPLYSMQFSADYRRMIPKKQGTLNPIRSLQSSRSWACSLFTTSGDGSNPLYGRNFDWEHSPALLLFNSSPGVYQSVSMVNLDFLRISKQAADAMDTLPIQDRQALLSAPYLPIDGMNEHGLVVGMAAVPNSEEIIDTQKPTVDSLLIMRIMLDQARNVDEALIIMQSYNIAWEGGPPLHYLLADSTGKSFLVEYYLNEMVVISNRNPWHLATNFLVKPIDSFPQGACWRYDKIHQELVESAGMLSPINALQLLDEVSQANTQWSIVYEMHTGNINVVMGRDFESTHVFQLSPK